ncbi:HAD family hydrolase [Niallia sp. XMNu-256]|uniref:HAD family hydrolase n=1 Tax=Niallia sp. XMNu-256 TaxID=3082444 RepID=UPI0030D2A8A6
MDYKIVFLDIDGTILMPDHTYTESTKEAIGQLKDQGIEVFIATGRPIHEIKELAEELKVTSFIGYNGALAIHNNKPVVDEPMKRSLVLKLLETARELHSEMLLYTSGKNYFTNLEHPDLQNFADTFQFKNNYLLTDEVLDQILGISIINVKPSEIAHFEIDDTLRLSEINVEGIEDAVDVIRTHVNKGEAIKKILHRLNINREQSIAFGDGMNDKEMIEVVGEGFAMGNSHPDLFQYAKHTTTSVSDSGIYNGLKKLGIVN